MRVILTGTREYRDALSVEKVLKHLSATAEAANEPLTVMHFATNMVDGIVLGLAQSAGINVTEAAPDWRSNGKSALYRHADAIIPTADRVVLFGRDSVTEHSITVANANNIPVSNVVPVPVVEELPV